ncbi:DNA-protecting protein DprA [Candidatus Sumerlaeota bacterium]|nr:DNA-protecting protein DprA [Candidatus Sumerlaeota bacterium]
MAVRDEDSCRQWLRLVGCSLDRATLGGALANAESPEELLEAGDEELAARFHFSPRHIQQFRRQPPPALLDKQMGTMEKQGIDLVAVSDRAFPRNLFRVRVPPPAIFMRGKIEDADALAVGIVGPRIATTYGLTVTKAFARDFAPTMTVVSGAALGIDSAAHGAVMDAGGRTIAVLGCGLDVNYPAGNERLRERIAAEGGALVTTYPPGTQPLRGNFPARNEILAGLSLAVVVVEASATSGALVTARAAGEEGRPVYAVPGDVTRKNSVGSNGLLRDGAIACMSAGDVLADLEAMLIGELEGLRDRRRGGIQDPAGRGPEAPATTSNTPQENLLLAAIQHSAVTHDDLMAQFVPSRLSVGDLSTALLMLEMKGMIEQLPGRLYSPKL